MIQLKNGGYVMNYLVIIPAYNEEKNVPDLIAKIKETGYDYLVINDCSTDNSSLVYEKLNIREE